MSGKFLKILGNALLILVVLLISLALFLECQSYTVEGILSEKYRDENDDPIFVIKTDDKEFDGYAILEPADDEYFKYEIGENISITAKFPKFHGWFWPYW